MKVQCPFCKTTYAMKDKIPSKSVSTVICVVCDTQLEVIPRGVFYFYIPKVIVRNG